MAEVLFGVPLGFLLWFFVRYGVLGFYTVGPNERAVLSTFGRAQRLGGGSLEDPIAQALRPDERDRYKYPAGPGDRSRVLHWKLPWQSAHKVSDRDQHTVSIAYDPEDPQANSGGRVLEAVTKDQLNTGLNGQLRFTISGTQSCTPTSSGSRTPSRISWVISCLGAARPNRELRGAGRRKPRLDASNEAGGEVGASVQGISINDLRKNLRDLNDHMADQAAAPLPRASDIELGCGADHRHRPATRRGLGAGRHQHRAQSRIERDQLGASLGGSEDRAIAPRGRDRDAPRAGRGRAAPDVGRAARRILFATSEAGALRRMCETRARSGSGASERANWC